MTPHSSEFYAKGYCLRQYDIARDMELFRFNDEMFRVPAGVVKSVPVRSIFPTCEGLIASSTVAKIDDVRKAYENSAAIL